MQQPIWHEEALARTNECDFQGRWKPSALFAALIEAAANHAAQLGYPFESMRSVDKAWVLSRFKLFFQCLPEMGERVRIQTWPKGVQQRLFFTRDFLAHSQDGGLLAYGTSAWLLINPQARRILPPQALGGPLPENALSAVDDLLEKINPPAGLTERFAVQPRYSAVDVLQHANSVRYLEWILDCFPLEMHRTRRLRWVQVNFVNETLPGEELVLAAGAAPDGSGLWWVRGSNRSSQAAFEAALQWDEGENPST